MTYDIKLADGVTSLTDTTYSWLTVVDLVTPSITISTTDDADTGVYDFTLEGVYGSSTYVTSTTF